MEVSKIKDIILGFFQLILKISFKLINDIVNKGLRVNKVFSEKGLEVRPNDRSGAFIAAFVLFLSKSNKAIKV